MRMVPTIAPNLPYMYNHPPQTTTRSSTSSYSVEQGDPNRSRGNAGQMKMCDVSATVQISLLSFDLVG